MNGPADDAALAYANIGRIRIADLPQYVLMAHLDDASFKVLLDRFDAIEQRLEAIAKRIEARL